MVSYYNTVKKEGNGTDILELVEDLNEGMRKSGKKSLTEGVYRDVPILRPASALQRPAPQRLPEPPEYRKMRGLGNLLSCTSATEAMIFCEQGKLMAEFEDDFPYRGGFTSFYPTYRAMSYRQLRGYFTWRTRLRRGDLQKTDLSFALVYVYELLNLIGCRDAAEAYGRLTAFAEAYGAHDRYLAGCIRPWLRDFTVYYGLPVREFAETEDPSTDERLMRLTQPQTLTDDELYGLLTCFSSFRPENSRFYKACGADYREAVCRVYRTLDARSLAEDGASLLEARLCRLQALPCTMFANAVFYDRLKTEDRVYKITPFFRYECRDGKWTCWRFARQGEKNTALGAFMREIDCLMRKAYGFPHKTKRGAEGDPALPAVLKAELAAMRAAREEAARPRVTIDLSALADIRAAAAQTQGRLMTEEEMWTEPAPAPAPAPAPEQPQARPAAAECALPLGAEELAFLTALAAGDDPAPALKAKGIPPGVMAERVNDLLYETFADNVIDFDGDTPVLADYYLEAIRGMLQL